MCVSGQAARRQHPLLALLATTAAVTYLLFLYAQMAYVTTKHYHSFAEWAAALVCAASVLRGYVALFDRTRRSAVETARGQMPLRRELR